VINPSQRPLPDNTQHSQQTNIHAAGGIRTHNLSGRTAVDLRLEIGASSWFYYKETEMSFLHLDGTLHVTARHYILTALSLQEFDLVSLIYQ